MEMTIGKKKFSLLMEITIGEKKFSRLMEITIGEKKILSDFSSVKKHYAQHPTLEIGH